MDDTSHPAPGVPVPDPAQGVYGISVAAALSGVSVQSLRALERHGLLTPSRSDGGTRRYSGDDLARLRRITALQEQGINLAGIARILDLEDANSGLHADNSDLRTTNTGLHADNFRLRAEADQRREPEPPQPRH
ncbi:MerR family transcriptional regulator [Nocardia sp. BMG111209]|uniref:MerR family transcriptional regulator n=1 Tax=Nocardia sp. BMG111209 TaxID=1160137 RepID=UPI000370717B|nr:MerR family transcriptional regulator [Nocardia sp. BMG111209]